MSKNSSFFSGRNGPERKLFKIARSFLLKKVHPPSKKIGYAAETTP